ncbi:MAG TPA: biotin synthase BioB [Chlamydiales bacterium]|nr:biotin synthase BioB [Chlamydiales bacterium]
MEQIITLYQKPLKELLFQAISLQGLRQKNIEKCSLLSIKTGGCSEDCKYCAQSSRYCSSVQIEKITDINYVVEKAREAKNSGSDYFCLSAAWRKVRDNLDFQTALKMVEAIKENVGIQVCCTFGMLTYEMAQKLKDAGVVYYNHNLDTSESFYPEIITTRKYQDRLETLKNATQAGLKICTGCILGLGEKVSDRIELIHTLKNLPHALDAFVLNTLIPIPGTPLEKNSHVPFKDVIRFIAVCRITLKNTQLRWAAGRDYYSDAEQMLAMLAGIDSIHVGAKLLTAKNHLFAKDAQFLKLFEEKIDSIDSLSLV